MTLKKSLQLLLFSTFLLLRFYPVTAQAAENEVSEEALAAINAAIADVRAEMEKRGRERESVYSSLQDAEKNIARLARELASIESGIAESEDRLSQLARQREDLQTRKNSQQTLIAQYIRSAYKTGRQEYFKLLLNQENPALVARTLNYYRYFNDARQARVEEYSGTIDELRTLEQEISASTRELNAQREDLKTQQTSFESARAQRQDLLDELDVVLSRSGKKLEALEADRVEMELLIEELRRSIVNLSLGDQQQPFASLKGKLPWPLEGPLKNSWGSKVGLGDLSWQGVTIAARQGSTVRAIHHGRVVYADWFSNEGLLLIIDHGDGYMSLYAHNQELYKDVGEWVTSGESIAAVGNTGGQAEYGLYFEIRHNGDAENPANWLATKR